MTELKKTCLNAAHRALGARMVDFGGWEMPVNYGSQIEEHRAVRADAGMFDVSHMCVVEVQGERARDLLRFALANNIDKLQTPGRALYSCLLNPQGQVIDDLIAYFFDEREFRLVVNASTAEKDVAWLNRLNRQGGYRVTLTPRRDLAIIAVQGPNARHKVWRAAPETRAPSEALKPFNAACIAQTGFGPIMVARTGYTGEEGFELVLNAAQAVPLWQALLQAGVRPCGLGARDTLRLEAGMNLYGQDMDETISPLDAGLAWTVNLHAPRDFCGKAALLAQADRAAFVGLVLADEGGMLRAHQTVVTPHGEGTVTSGTFSPSLKRSIALARVPGAVRIGDSVKVRIRDRQLTATVVKLPFVRHGQVLVS